MRNFVLIGVVLFLSACTIQKRHFRSGYDIQWNKKYRASGAETTNNEEISKTSGENFILEHKIDEEKHQTGNFASHDQDKSVISEKHISNTYTTQTVKIDENTALSQMNDQERIDEESLNNRTFFNSEKKNNKKSGDFWMYVFSGLLTISSFAGVFFARKKLKGVTRWAKYNPKSARYLIASIQLPLLGFGIVEGYNLAQMGYELSDSFFYTNMLAFAASSALIPFLPQNDQFILPGRLNRRRLTFLAAMVAGTMTMVGYGNSVGVNDEPSYAKTVLSQVDQSVFGDDFQDEITDSVNDVEEYTDQDMSALRAAASAGLCALAVLLFILLTCLLCAGVCMIIYGVAFAVGGASTGLLFGGIAVTGLTVFSMVKLANAHWCRS